MLSSQHQRLAADDVDADAVLVFSSGTTGFPKAVRHTHRSMGHGVQHWITALGLTDDDRFQIATPPVHILGLLNIFTARRRRRAVPAAPAGSTSTPRCARCRTSGSRSTRRSRRSRSAWRTTPARGVRPLVAALRDVGCDAGRRGGGGHGHPPVRRALAPRRTAPARCPVIVCNPVQEPDRWRLDTRRARRARASRSASSIPSAARCSPAGETGEIEVLSPSAMAGYLPESETAAAFRDGWYRTGDIGWLEPEGWLHITDRLKEMVKVRGFQVAPAEIEAVLHGDPRGPRLRGVRRARSRARRGDRRRGRAGRRRGRHRRGAAGRGGVTARGLQARAPRGVRRRDPTPAVGQGPPPHAQGAVARPSRPMRRDSDDRVGVSSPSRRRAARRSPSSRPCTTSCRRSGASTGPSCRRARAACAASPAATMSFRCWSWALITSSADSPWWAWSHGPPSCLHVIVFIGSSSVRRFVQWTSI